MAGGPVGRSLENTPTWAVALVTTLFVVISLIVERSLHYMSHWFSKTKRKPLYEALEKIKEELMLLGFLSFLITVTSDPISEICVRTSFFNKHLMPCGLDEKKSSGKKNFLVDRILSELSGRSLAEKKETKCKDGTEEFISYKGLVQLHKFLFVLGCIHIFYSCMAMILAMMKVYTWKKWEDEAHAHVDRQQNMKEVCRNLTMRRQSTFVQHHTVPPVAITWVICFFRQFGESVAKADYLALRLGFISKHNTGLKYDFHGYMIRSMEEEFKEFVGISPIFWIYVVLFMLLNINGSNLYFWISFVPVVMVLVVGAKLQKIIAQLALENSGLAGPFGALNLRPRDSLFWFSKPRLIMHLIHFIQFQVAFELAVFIWVWWQFGWDSCFMGKKVFAYILVVTGFLVQVLCSFSTLPLYALVTQMGSNFKKTIFQENVVESLHHWRDEAKHRVKDGSSHHHREEHRSHHPGESLGNEIERDVEHQRVRAVTTPQHITSIEKVPNTFTQPNDSLLSPRMFGPTDVSSEIEMGKGSYERGMN